jgi:hypothetical protein
MVDGLILRMSDDATILLSTVDLEITSRFSVVGADELQGKNEKLAGIRSGGTLIINSHGSATTVSGRSVNDLAQLLYDSGLRGPVEIVLLACNTGTLGAPFALELKITLVQRYKIMCGVSAPLGRVGTNIVGEWKVRKDDGTSVPFGEEGSAFSTTKSF